MAADAFGRTVEYLRISVTDRCNLRCSYCLPARNVRFLPRSQILRYEEIERFAKLAVEAGVRRIRLTGGEPLVRKGFTDHVRRLTETTSVPVALTTNGTLLAEAAADLAAAGVSRVNISIDSLDPGTYRRVTGGRLADALAGMDAALAVGLDPVKVNVVVVRSLGQDLAGFARLTLEDPIHVRFIEYMPVGPGGETPYAPDWSPGDHVPAAEILQTLADAGLGLLEEVPEAARPEGWGPARLWRLPGALGTVGLVAPLSRHFCDSCDRLRLTADGRLRLCLFSDTELDVGEALRRHADDDVRRLIREAALTRPMGHDLMHGTGRRMSQIGG